MGAGNVTPVLISGDNSNIQGSVICSGAMFRREKVRGDLLTGPSITAQSRCSSMILPPFTCQSNPASPR